MAHPLLEKITDPSDVKRLSISELECLATELREEIVETVLDRGGHLASNLGTVELTLAMLRCFDLEKDQVIFDVGHQSYAYKLLTKRRRDFSTLRQIDGLSGFPKREESRYDAFNTGHASTSLSAAEGIHLGQALQKIEGRVIAFIGDGALTGGMCWEAINNIVERRDPVIIILNDNQMSIDANIGGVHRLLSELRVQPTYLQMKQSVRHRLDRKKVIGPKLSAFLSRCKRSLRRRLNAPSGLFESLGLRYYGPVDGHNIAEIERYFRAASIASLRGPVLVHCVSQKGKSYAPAEASPDHYHGVSPSIPGLRKEIGGRNLPAVEDPRSLDFDTLRKQLGETQKFTEAFAYGLDYLASKNSKITATTAAMRSGTGLSRFAEHYPDRFFDVGIAEQHALTMAAGLATTGMRPVVALYSTFLQRAFDQLLHDVCLQNLPLTLAIDRAGIVGEDGETHQGIYDLSFLLALPNLEVFSPSDPHALFLLLEYATERATSPVIIRYSRDSVALPREFWSKLEHGDPSPWRPILQQPASETLVISYGNNSADCLALIREVDQAIDLIHLETLKPLDEPLLLTTLRKYKRIRVVEEVAAPGAIAPILAKLLIGSDWHGDFDGIHLPPHPILHGDSKLCREREGLYGAQLLNFLIPGEG
ncbi:MAG: 1-deoxy-D-xylulose-5-phosphate synthase [Eubacteriales bacterium]|nr:1-deoxy-D-xylulose-5-phosphate synthase [Eubacteriales bacterium]